MTKEKTRPDTESREQIIGTERNVDSAAIFKEKERLGKIVDGIPRIAHDLRKPLGNIISLSDILLEELLKKENMRTEELVERIERGDVPFEDPRHLAYLIRKTSRYGHRLTDTLLDLNLLNEKRKHLLESVDFRVDVMSHVISMYSHELGYRFNETYSPNKEIVVRGNKLLLSRLMSNLFDNAINYSEKTAKLRFYGSEKKKYYEFHLENEHVGLRKEQLERIFDTGERLKEVTKSGFGIGLNNCKRIVENIHGGKIWAESKSGNPGYVRVKFTLPKYE